MKIPVGAELLSTRFAVGLAFVAMAGCPGDGAIDADGSSSNSNSIGETSSGDDTGVLPTTTDPTVDTTTSGTTAIDPTTGGTDTTATTETTEPGFECGNGVIEGDEACDTGELGGATCMDQGFGGGGLACTAECTLDTSQCNDCGNGMVDGDEQCDGDDLGDNTNCADVDLGTAMEPLGCTAGCTYDFSMCSGCGDAVITEPEQCEPASETLMKDDLGGKTCVDLGFDDGLLSCAASCTFNVESCFSCGDAVQQGQEQCDAGDFGVQTCADFLSPSMEAFSGGSLTCTDDCTVDTANCSLCGDGVVSGGEVCEIGVLGAETCATQGFEGGVLACAADCSGFDTAACTTCGDAVIQGDEQCDEDNLGGSSCGTLGFTGGTLKCSDACVFDTAMCTNALCGDGTIDGNDQCDCGDQGTVCTAAQLGNQTCATQGFGGGTLACNSPTNCQFATAGCFSCGDGTINAGETCDGVNLGGATCVSQGFGGGGTLGCNNTCGFDTSQCVNVANPYVTCISPNQAIIGSGPGINNPSIINVPVMGNVTDVNVSITALHTWVGDLRFRLSHGNTTRFVIDNPYYGYCDEDDIDVTIDDEGPGGFADDVCAPTKPAIFSPPSRRPTQTLSPFDGAQMQGDWRLITDDSYAGDDGVLTKWCLSITWQ